MSRHESHRSRAVNLCPSHQASSSDIESAFNSGDMDGDDTLSVSEASSAIQSLSGRSVDEGTISSACSSCGVPTYREMDR